MASGGPLTARELLTGSVAITMPDAALGRAARCSAPSRLFDRVAIWAAEAKVQPEKFGYAAARGSFLAPLENGWGRHRLSEPGALARSC